MRIGIPKETKPFEGRVALLPEAVDQLVQAGHTVIIEANAGILSGYSNNDYTSCGAKIGKCAEEAFQTSDLIIKVKEPIAHDLALLQPNHTLFCFLHLAATPTLTQKLQQIGLTAIGFETLAENNQLPLLAPMSEIAGQVAVQAGAYYLHSTHHGKGVLLGGIANTDSGHVVILGAGAAGLSAATLAAASGAKVTIFDRKEAALTKASTISPSITALNANPDDIAENIANADLLIGAILIPGASAPKIITREMICSMTPGSVFVDISVDQGGCAETTHPTDYANPAYEVDGVIHMAVTNLPGAVARTATQALSSALLPYVLRLAAGNWQQDSVLSSAVNVQNGNIVHPALQQT